MPSTPTTTFRQTLAKAGLSQAAFARMAGVSMQTVSRWRDDAPRWACVLAEYHLELQGLRKRERQAQALWRDPVDLKAVGYEFRHG